MNTDSNRFPSSNSIYHIFKADAYFHTLDMIENIIKFSKYKHFFVIVGINEITKPFFDTLFLNHHYNQYTYIYEKSSSRSTRLISNILKRLLHIELLNFENDLLKYISNSSINSLILHSNFTTMFYLLFSFMKNINKTWVCWGSIYNPKRSNFIKYTLGIYLYKIIYNNYSNIICTMQADCDHLIKLYNVKNTCFIPYYSDLCIVAKSLIKEEIKNNNIRVLLGNNGSCVDSYYADLRKLEIHKNKNIEIDCMLNYGCTEKQKLNLISTAVSHFGSQFKAHTTLLPKEQYYNFMSNCDIYISSVKAQSGLGAIYLLLLLGKKIFLAGKNYEHIHSFDAIIYQSDQIMEFSFQEFCKPLTNKEKEHNYLVTMKLLNIEDVVIKWEQFYNKLS